MNTMTTPEGSPLLLPEEASSEEKSLVVKSFELLFPQSVVLKKENVTEIIVSPNEDDQ